MKQNKLKMIVSSAVILLPVLIGILLWDKLPDTMTTHWGADGQADGFSSKRFTVFALPIFMFVMHWFCMWITGKDPKNKEQSVRVFDMLLWIFPAISLIMNGMVYAISLGHSTGVDVWIRVLIGLLFFIMGNYLPKCKQNHTIGVKVSWTLGNEDNWYKTHRFTGHLWVVCGLLVLVTIFIPVENIMWLFVAVMIVAGFVPMLYSYLYYRKQLKAGTVTKEEIKKKSGMGEKNTVILAVALGVPALILAGVVLFAGAFQVEFAQDSFTIQANMWDDLTVDYDKITDIEYREQDVPGARIYGYGSFSMMMGHFENEEFGGYIRYSYMDCRACVVVRSEEKVLVINGEDENATKELYEKLCERIQK